LGLFALGIFASCLIPLVFRAFFAFQDTKTPTVIAVVAMVLNVGLCLGFTQVLSFPNFFQDFMIRFFALQGIKDISVIGLPLAFSLDSIFQLILLMIFLRKKINIKI